jgi:hypothetical protein
VFRDLDYARLKRSFAYFVEHYVPAELMTLESDPVKFIERLETSRMSQARRSLAIGIADFIEGTQDFCGERVAEIDRVLQKRDAYTLSFLREHFTRRRDRI